MDKSTRRKIIVIFQSLIGLILLIGSMAFGIFCFNKNADSQNLWILFAGLLSYPALALILMMLSQHYECMELIAFIFLLPIEFFQTVIPWFKLFLMFVVVVFGTAAVVFYVSIFFEIILWHKINLPLTLYLSFTLGTMFSSFSRYGSFILKVSFIKRMFVERMKTTNNYDKDAMRYTIYLIYFIALFLSYTHQFYAGVSSLQPEIIASFLTYFAYDRLLLNKDLIANIKQESKVNLFKHLNEMLGKRK